MDVRSFVVTLVLMSPAVLVGLLRRALTINLTYGVIPAFGTVLLALFIVGEPVLLVLWVRSWKVGMYRRTLVASTIFVILTVVVDLALPGSELKSLPFLLTAMPALHLAVALHAFIGAKRVQGVWRLFISIMTVYLVINIIVWAVYLAPGQGPSAGLSYRRMGGSLAGDVLLGYLIAAILPVKLYFIANRGSKLTPTDVITVCVLLLSSFLTGSRGGLWLSVLSLLVWVLKEHRPGNAVFLAAPFVIALLAIRELGVQTTRLTVLQDVSRTSSWRAAVMYWSRLPLVEKIVGAGWGRVYPYYEWLQAGQSPWNNTFYLGGTLSVVQPHNAFVWALVEGGIVGVILFFWPFWESTLGCFIRSVGRGRKSAKRGQQNVLLWLALATLILTNALDSQLILAPNVALISWFLLFSLPALFETCGLRGPDRRATFEWDDVDRGEASVEPTAT